MLANPNAITPMDRATPNGVYATLDRREIARILPSGYGTVLEVGCASGGFRSCLKSEAVVWGIEPNPSAAAHAGSKGYRTLVGTYDQVADQIPERYFDVVVCNDVIEHMADHEGFLRSIRGKLKSGGVIVGSIPNVRYVRNLARLLVLGDWKYEDVGILDRTHLRFFTRTSLLRTFRDCQYDVQFLDGINSHLSTARTAKQWLANAALVLLIALTLGSARDTQYLQFRFRVTPR